MTRKVTPSIERYLRIIYRLQEKNGVARMRARSGKKTFFGFEEMPALRDRKIKS